MALPQINQPFVPSTQEQLRDAILADYRLEMIKTTGFDPSVVPGTEVFVWATAHSSIAMLQFANIELSRDAITPLNATGQDLENWRTSLGLPEVQASPSSGKIRVTVEGVGTLTDGQPFQLPNGLRGTVVGNWVAIVDGSEVDVVTTDTGSKTEFDGGTPVTLVSPPSVFNTTALVSTNSPLRGGRDKEDDDRKRTRVLNAVANKPSGGNWAKLRELALNALASVQDCYVYPALGGPASVKVVPVRDFDVKRREFTRAMNAGALSIVRAAIYNEVPDGMEVVVEASADQEFDATIAVAIPASSLSGGSGNGWVDQPITPDTVPWPQLAGGQNVVIVLSVTSSTQIVIGANSATSPIAGQTHIMWWSPADMKFRQFLITAVDGASGPSNWIVTVDRPMVADDGTLVAFGDYISPAAVNADAYADAWLNALRALGPGENTSDTDRVPRALRHPYVSDEDPSAATFLTLKAFQSTRPEISDLEWLRRVTDGGVSITKPTVPASVADPVNILVPKHFGIYGMT